MFVIKKKHLYDGALWGNITRGVGADNQSQPKRLYTYLFTYNSTIEAKGLKNDNQSFF
jgi:hypothetical protein